MRVGIYEKGKPQRWDFLLQEIRKCGNCRRVYVSDDMAEAIDNLGECLNCDHVRGDVI